MRPIFKTLCVRLSDFVFARSLSQSLASTRSKRLFREVTQSDSKCLCVRVFGLVWLATTKCQSICLNWFEPQASKQMSESKRRKQFVSKMLPSSNQANDVDANCNSKQPARGKPNALVVAVALILVQLLCIQIAATVSADQTSQQTAASPLSNPTQTQSAPSSLAQQTQQTISSRPTQQSATQLGSASQQVPPVAASGSALEQVQSASSPQQQTSPTATSTSVASAPTGSGSQQQVKLPKINLYVSENESKKLLGKFN